MLWLKAFHIVLVIAWFAGLFYLPRIFVNLAMEENENARARLLLMAQKLYRFINPLAVLTLLSGLGLWLYYGIGQGALWLYAKLFFVLLLVGYHHGCGALLKKFAAGRNTRSHSWYRWFNEVPVLILIAIVLLVVLKPF